MKTPRRIVWLGSVILTATAILHCTGYPDVTGAVASSNLEGMLSGVIGGLWLFPTIHWLFLALLAVAVAAVRSPATPVVLGLIAGVLGIDIVLLLIYVGPFLGEVMLGAAALTYVAAAAGHYRFARP